MVLAEGRRRIKGAADVLNWRSKADIQQLWKSEWTKRITRKNKGINPEGVEQVTLVVPCEGTHESCRDIETQTLFIHKQ